MKQIDYKEAVELMAFAGRTDVVIMVREVEPIDYNTLYALEKEKQVMFFIPDDPAEDKCQETEKSTTPSNPPAAKRRQVDGGKIMALHRAGWPVAKIADEMQVSQQTVYAHLKKMEEKTDGAGHVDGRSGDAGRSQNPGATASEK